MNTNSNISFTDFLNKKTILQFIENLNHLSSLEKKRIYDNYISGDKNIINKLLVESIKREHAFNYDDNLASDFILANYGDIGNSFLYIDNDVAKDIFESKLMENKTIQNTKGAFELIFANHIPNVEPNQSEISFNLYAKAKMIEKLNEVEIKGKEYTEADLDRLLSLLDNMALQILYLYIFGKEMPDRKATISNLIDFIIKDKNINNAVYADFIDTIEESGTPHPIELYKAHHQIGIKNVYKIMNSERSFHVIENRGYHFCIKEIGNNLCKVYELGINRGLKKLIKTGKSNISEFHKNKWFEDLASKSGITMSAKYYARMIQEYHKTYDHKFMIINDNISKNIENEPMYIVIPESISGYSAMKKILISNDIPYIDGYYKYELC